MPRINKVRHLADVYPDLDVDTKVARWKKDGHSLDRIAEELNQALEVYLKQEEPKRLNRLPELRVDKQNVQRFFKSPQEAKARQVALSADKRRGVKAVAVQIALQLSAAENLRTLKGLIDPFRKALEPIVKDLQAPQLTGDRSQDREEIDKLKDLFYAVEPVVRTLSNLTMNEHQVHKDSLTLEMAAIFLKKVMYYVRDKLSPDDYWSLIKAMEADPQIRPAMVALGMIDEDIIEGDGRVVPDDEGRQS